jgi:hypothetical protein
MRRLPAAYRLSTLPAAKRKNSNVLHPKMVLYLTTLLSCRLNQQFSGADLKSHSKTTLREPEKEYKVRG